MWAWIAMSKPPAVGQRGVRGEGQRQGSIPAALMREGMAGVPVNVPLDEANEFTLEVGPMAATGIACAISRLATRRLSWPTGGSCGWATCRCSASRASRIRRSRPSRSSTAGAPRRSSWVNGTGARGEEAGRTASRAGIRNPKIGNPKQIQTVSMVKMQRREGQFPSRPVRNLDHRQQDKGTTHADWTDPESGLRVRCVGVQ